MPVAIRAKQNQSVIGLFRALKVDRAALPATRPFYRQLVALIERGVARHEVAPGFQLPPERDLTRAFECFPTEALRRAIDTILTRTAATALKLGPTEGMPRFRAAIADRFGGLPENILVLAGAQQGLDLLARCLVDPGDAVIVDRPGYLGAISSFRCAGARLIGWDIQRADLDELEDLVLRYRPKVMYVNPTFQNPSGWTMPLKT